MSHVPAEAVAAELLKAGKAVTRAQIAAATGRTIHSARKWTYEVQDFPEPLPAAYRTAESKFPAGEVANWYSNNPRSRDEPGPHRHPARAAAKALPDTDARVSVKELADALNVSASAIDQYVRLYTSETTDDPFPSKGRDRKRSLSEVRDWLLRAESRARKPGRRPDRDDLDLTPRQRQALEAVKAYKARGGEVTAGWLAGEFGVSLGVAYRLLQKIRGLY
ncbi:hypothetical protein [Kitasatospora sp. NPDC088783]|uniref:hypothetical protein n=1 Tax=Kitasatospora sp. NPDC088783 TaxID=3364077 RepID=UPI00381181B7